VKNRVRGEECSAIKVEKIQHHFNPSDTKMRSSERPSLLNYEITIREETSNKQSAISKFCCTKGSCDEAVCRRAISMRKKLKTREIVMCNIHQTISQLKPSIHMLCSLARNRSEKKTQLLTKSQEINEPANAKQIRQRKPS
jgi:hypothetical protein